MIAERTAEAARSKNIGSSSVAWSYPSSGERPEARRPRKGSAKLKTARKNAEAIA